MTAKPAHLPDHVGYCMDCGKLSYRSRKAARRAARAAHPGESLQAYEAHPGVWHYGHSHVWRFTSTVDATQTALAVKAHQNAPQTALPQILMIARASQESRRDKST